MSRYIYMCEFCGKETEIEGTMKETRPSEIECVCGETAKRVYYPIAIHFKGKGFTKANEKNI